MTIRAIFALLFSSYGGYSILYVFILNNSKNKGNGFLKKFLKVLKKQECNGISLAGGDLLLTTAH